MRKDRLPKDASDAECVFFENLLNELPIIAKAAKSPLRRQHLLRIMFELAEGAEMHELKEKVGDVKQRTLESDLTYLRRHGVLRSKPGKKMVRKWGRPSRKTRWKSGRPPIEYWLVNAHDLITSNLVSNEERRELISLERRLIGLPEFKRQLERELDAAMKIVKMPSQIIEGVRPFRKIRKSPEFKHLFQNLPPSDEIKCDYSKIDAAIPGELADQVLVRTRISIPGEFSIPFEAAFRMRLDR